MRPSRASASLASSAPRQRRAGTATPPHGRPVAGRLLRAGARARELARRAHQHRCESTPVGAVANRGAAGEPVPRDGGAGAGGHLVRR